MKFCYILLIGLFVVVFSNAQTTTYMNPSYEYISKQTSLPSKIPLNPPIAEKTITTTMKTVFITTTKTASATLLPLPDDINYCKDNNTCDIITLGINMVNGVLKMQNGVFVDVIQELLLKHYHNHFIAKLFYKTYYLFYKHNL
ncbi:hypothetical protein BCR36DRAFT_446199 [Piromyces finnis]|uniref:Uncharacterized protein n=1 Tax=Piromyces finnis TaxID=1754191 RepID=A0A1Y1UAZ2_9FUNG|nr:hypothetical protein BCR36DRAFT_446199 [Piromyces finnis]|eukprot:ORX35208.1 hypothetical protein BCR36DRAFT_446199 [Piromyces finnis]